MEVDPLPDTLSRTNITKLKQHFARHGIPLIIMTDNGPQFTAAEFKHFASSGILLTARQVSIILGGTARLKTL